MAWPSSQVAVGDIVTAAQLNMLPIQLASSQLTGASASFDLTSIPQVYNHLKLVMSLRGDDASTGVNVLVRFNGDAGANYDFEQLEAYATSTSAAESFGSTFWTVAGAPAASAPASAFAAITIWIPQYSYASALKTALSDYSVEYAASSGNLRRGMIGGVWHNTAAINRITILAAAGNWVVGSRVSLYGCP